MKYMLIGYKCSSDFWDRRMQALLPYSSGFKLWRGDNYVDMLLECAKLKTIKLREDEIGYECIMFEDGEIIYTDYLDDGIEAPLHSINPQVESTVVVK